ncbi:PREDICTED: cyclic GMP-AMP synthase-like [Crocodylus porosus]|uniref:cyclic GMP-AMP synthase-like n=1 Tax=Crocodylus porosus TaxID=8502 RepID=UPI00093C3401|nr:PREDICTED: cyclic GMP-AMP synthase-like [Crocodylus porosus]XP_019407881.1 PREDICTED: cyclic GMP-AMP synthase-like [Crocodylus porosus]
MPKLTPGKKNPTPESTKQKKVSQREAGCGRDKTTQYNEEQDGPGVVVHLQFLSVAAEFAASTPRQKSWALVAPESSEQLSKSDPQQRRRRKAPGAITEVPATVPDKRQSKQSIRTNENKEEGNAPQRKARGRQGKGTVNEEGMGSSTFAAPVSPLEVHEFEARRKSVGQEAQRLQSPERLKGANPLLEHCPRPKRAPSAQKKREAAGARIGQAYSRPAFTDSCDGSEVAVATLPKPSRDDIFFRVKERVKSLPLKHDERAKAAGIINEFIDSFISYLKKCEERPYFKEVTKMTTGSYYEFVKVAHPDEFDVMLSLPVPKYVRYEEVAGYTGLYYKVTLERNTRSFLTPFLLDDGCTVSPVKVLEEFRKHVNHFINSHYQVRFPGWNMKPQRKKPNCPAVTVMVLDDKGGEVISMDLVPALEISASWPASCGIGKDVEKWLGKKSMQWRNKSFYFVAKQPPGEDNKETWRISFSHIEKKILNNHGNTKTCCESYGTKCCRKNCIRLLKSLISELKKQYPRQLSHVCSYYAKTSFLHTLTQVKDDSDWKPTHVVYCFLRVLDDFIQHVENASLFHFFIPNCNLFSSLPPKELKFLLDLLQEQKNNGLPAFATHEEQSLPHSSAHGFVTETHRNNSFVSVIRILLAFLCFYIILLSV